MPPAEPGLPVEPLPVEPWLRGPLPGIPPFLAPLWRSFEMVREDLSRWTAGLTVEQLWARPNGLAPAGTHIRHLGRSALRLMTYAAGRTLAPEQLADLATEMTPGESYGGLRAELDRNLAAVEVLAMALDADDLAAPRGVGRKQLPSTVIGIAWHVAEHSQRHLGQAITIARIVQASSLPG